MIKIRVPGPKSAHFLRPPARRPWLPTVALLASRPQRPQDAHAPGAALQAGNARPWPMAGYIHPRHHCAVASLVHRLFSSSVDALESQVQFCWQEAHGERHEASGRGARPDRSPRMRAPTRAAARAAQRRTTLTRSRRQRRRRCRTRSARRAARQAGRRTRASTRGTRQRPWRTSWRTTEACTRGLMVCRRDWFRTD